MSWLITIIVGALIGWIASLIAKSNLEQGWIADIIIGILGSILGRYLFYDILGIGAAAVAGTLTLAGILWGVLGAVILILILRALRIY